MSQFVRFKANLGYGLWPFAETTQCGAVELAKVNPGTVQGNNSGIGETATRFSGSSFVSVINSILPNVTTLRVKREIFDVDHE